MKFSDIDKGPPRTGGRRQPGSPKISFRKLAGGPPGNGQNPAPAAEADAVGDRKLLYEKACSYLNQVLKTIRKRQAFALEPGMRIVEKMAAVDPPRDDLFVMALHLDDRFKFVIHHSVNVAVYAVKMARELGFDRTARIQLGLTGLLHDVGMAVVPDRIIEKKSPLSPEEISIIRERPNYSYRILRAFGDEVGYLAEAAAQVYERIDGSGYPRGLKGDEITEYAQVIGLLDVYEALVHSRPHRKRLTHFAAVKKIINTSKHRFRRRYLKALLNLFSVFPIHSYVRLNSEAIGRVIETYPDHPLRPKIQIIFDSQKRRVLTERIVSLPENPLLNIVDSVTEEELQQLEKA